MWMLIPTISEALFGVKALQTERGLGMRKKIKIEVSFYLFILWWTTRVEAMQPAIRNLSAPLGHPRLVNGLALGREDWAAIPRQKASHDGANSHAYYGRR